MPLLWITNDINISFLKFTFLAIISGIRYHVYWPIIILKKKSVSDLLNKGVISLLIFKNV